MLSFMQNVFVQITNKFGSTTDPPVIIQASVKSDFGSLLPQRLKQLAETLQGSPARNLGLDNSVFGKVKGISLSSYLKGTLSSIPPRPSPAPAPGPSDYAESSISPFPSPPTYSSYPAPPIYSPAFSPAMFDPQPCFNCDASSPAPSVISQAPQPCPYWGFRIPPSSSPTSPSNPIVPSASTPIAPTPYTRLMDPTSKLSPDVSPIPQVSRASSPGESKGTTKGLVSSSIAPSPSCKLPCNFFFLFP